MLEKAPSTLILFGLACKADKLTSCLCPSSLLIMTMFWDSRHAYATGLQASDCANEDPVSVACWAALQIYAGQ